MRCDHMYRIEACLLARACQLDDHVERVFEPQRQSKPHVYFLHAERRPANS